MASTIPEHAAARAASGMQSAHDDADGCGIDELERLVARAAAAPTHDEAAQQVREGLEAMLQAGKLKVPGWATRSSGDHYARRVLAADPAGRWSIVAMAWGPHQSTPLHDHAGLWCVEGVCEGRITITQYDITGQESDRYRFERMGSTDAGCGACGSLIPPHEYHVVSNDTETPAVSVHVYGGEMSLCHVFEPDSAGWWRRTEKTLGVDP